MRTCHDDHSGNELLVCPVHRHQLRGQKLQPSRSLTQPWMKITHAVPVPLARFTRKMDLSQERLRILPSRLGQHPHLRRSQCKCHNTPSMPSVNARLTASCSLGSGHTHSSGLPTNDALWAIGGDTCGGRDPSNHVTVVSKSTEKRATSV